MRSLIVHIICAALVSVVVTVNGLYGGSFLYDAALVVLGTMVSAYHEYVNSICRGESKKTGVIVGVGTFILFLIVCLVAADIIVQGL